MSTPALHEMGLLELREALRSRTVSAREVVEDHLARIEAVNPALNAVVTVEAERALEAADGADRLAAAGGELRTVVTSEHDILDGIAWSAAERVAAGRG